MKKTILVMVFAVFCVSPLFPSGSTDYYAYSYSRLSYVKGDVFIQRADDLGYEEGVVNLVLVQGDKIGTREGRAEIHLGKRNYLRIDGQTQLDLIELPRRGSDQIQLHLIAGDIFLRVNLLEREKDFEIHTPDASFYVIAEGLYRLSVRENMQTEILVYEGIIEAAGEEGSLVVRQDESLIAANGFFLTDSQYYTSYDDSFALWNRSRDEMLVRYVETRYLPVELYEYEAELAYSGRWVYESQYGYVWVPYGVHLHWRPYHYGRWVWYPIIGWTWISYDPWGWVVSRYGRWHWRASLGWYWIPTTIWGPAWVHWLYGFNTIGWCPLSFWNRPVVIINNIFYGQHYDSSYPVQSTCLTVIHKNQLQARAVSEVALGREKIAQMGRLSLSARQPDLRPVVDRSSARFEKASKAMSRSHIRDVQKSYATTRTLDSRSVVGSRAAPGASTGAVSPGVIKRNPAERGGGAEGSERTMGSRTIRPYSSSFSRDSANRSSRSSPPRASSTRSSFTETRSAPSKQVVSPRTVKRYAPSGTKGVAERKAPSSRSAATPSRESVSRQRSSGSEGRSSAAISSRSDTSVKTSKSTDKARTGTDVKKSIGKNSLSPSKSPLISQRSFPSKNPSSTKKINTRGRSFYPSRSASSMSRVSPSRSASRSSAPAVRSSSPSRSSRSSSIRAPSRGSSRPSSSSMRSPSRNKSSSSGRSSSSSRSSGRRVKKQPTP